MSYDYTACKRFLECLFGFGALGKIKSYYKFASSKLRASLKGGNNASKSTAATGIRLYGDALKKRYQLPGNVLGLQWLNTNPQPIRNNIYISDNGREENNMIACLMWLK
ncbi:hypothetical protein TNCV_100931 [Trichonephila clavipes]|nr:hypothetical protein TNCV_100931 [Trichonephila clavipes]